MNNQSAAQKRASHALTNVLQVREQNDDGSYRSYVQSLPAAILRTGLGQACAMLLAGSDGEQKERKTLYEHLQSWLCRPDGPYPEGGDLIQNICGKEQPQYLLAHAEALAYLEWLKKFASAYLRKREEVDAAPPL